MLDEKDYLRAITFFLGKLHLIVIDTGRTPDNKTQMYYHTAINILTMQIKS